MKTRRLALYLLPFVLILAGCASTGGWNPLNAIFGRKAAAEAKAEAKASDYENAFVTAAQIEVVKTGVAINQAATEHPDSRAVAVAKRTNANAGALLNQREPLTVAEHDEAVATVEGLLSVETAKREAAERRQGEVEQDNRGMAEELGKLREKIEQLGRERQLEAANNLAVANESRLKTIWAWASTVGTVLFGVGMLIYRANGFSIATRVAGGLADLETKHGAGAADLARGALDSALDAGDKNKVFAALKTIAPKIALRVSAS